MSGKVAIKPKAQITLTPAPTRILVPNQEAEDLEYDLEEEEDELAQGLEEAEEEAEEEEEEEDEAEEEEEELQTPSNKTSETKPANGIQKRKPRTKKVYPPSDQMFTQLTKNLCELRELSRKAIALARETQKCAGRENRDLKNQIKKIKEEKPQRQARGFALPSLISREMVDYLVNVANIHEITRKLDGKPVGKIAIDHGVELARNELVAALCQHFRDSGMRKNDLDQRNIFLDDVTTKLFKIDPVIFKEDGGKVSPAGEPIVTYFDLSKYVAKHCGKNAVGH